MPVIDDTTREGIRATILELLAWRSPAASICPSDVARALKIDGPGWRALMPAVRDVAADMVRAGELRITRGAAELAPDDLGRGPIRLRRR